MPKRFENQNQRRELHEKKPTGPEKPHTDAVARSINGIRSEEETAENNRQQLSPSDERRYRQLRLLYPQNSPFLWQTVVDSVSLYHSRSLQQKAIEAANIKAEEVEDSANLPPVSQSLPEKVGSSSQNNGQPTEGSILDQDLGDTSTSGSQSLPEKVQTGNEESRKRTGKEPAKRVKTDPFQTASQTPQPERRSILALPEKRRESALREEIWNTTLSLFGSSSGSVPL